MKIKKQDLLKALEIVKPGLSSKEIVEQSGSFAFIGDRVVTFNDSISLSHPVDQMKLTGAVRAKELYEFLTRTDTEQIQIALSDNQLKLKTGHAKVGLVLEKEIKLPIEETGKVTDWEELPEEFASDLNFIKDSASKDMSRRVLTCVNVEEHCLEASDSFQIMRVYMNSEQPFPFPQTLIPAELIPEIVKIEPSLVAKTSGWLHFKNYNGTQLSCRILQDSYPSTEGHLEVEGQELIFPKKMIDIIERAMVFTQDDHLMDEEMQVLLKNKSLLVSGKNEYGWFKEKAPVKYQGDSTSFWITPYLLKNILERTNRCTLGEGKIRFEDDKKSWEYVAVLRGT